MNISPDIDLLLDTLRLPALKAYIAARAADGAQRFDLCQR